MKSAPSAALRTNWATLTARAPSPNFVEPVMFILSLAGARALAPDYFLGYAWYFSVMFRIAQFTDLVLYKFIILT